MKYVLIYQWIDEGTGMTLDYGVKTCETLETAEDVKREQEEYWKDMIEALHCGSKINGNEGRTKVLLSGRNIIPQAARKSQEFF